jgi:hypothetical protein
VRSSSRPSTPLLPACPCAAAAWLASSSLDAPHA